MEVETHIFCFSPLVIQFILFACIPFDSIWHYDLFFLGAAWVARENETLDFKKDYWVSWRGGINFGGLYYFLHQRPRSGRKNARSPTVDFGCWGRDVCPQDVEDADIWDQESWIWTIRKSKVMKLSLLPCMTSDLHYSTVITLVRSYCAASIKNHF